MNLRNKVFRIPFQVLLLTMLFGYLLAHPFSEAASSTPGEHRSYILIINTYTESSVWSENIITSVLRRVSQKKDCEVYTEHMNMMLMKDMGDVREFENLLKEQYGEHAPRMVVLLGSPVAMLRDFVKTTWPGISLVLCAEEDYIGSPQTYIDLKPIPEAERVPLQQLAYEDNITLLQTPVFLNENIKLMRRMIPALDSLIFVGDGSYLCQQTDTDLSKVVATEFPTLHYRFYSAAGMSTEQLFDSLARIDTRRTGVLFASWNYAQRQANNNYILFTDIYRIAASTPVPMFSLFPVGIKGSDLVGGCVYDDDAYKKRLDAVIDAVMDGTEARDIPFYTPKPQPFVDYRTLERKGLSPKLSPPGTIFFNKPESAFERYMWPLLILGVSMLGLILFQQWRIGVMQRLEEAHAREKESRDKYANLFNNMPIIYAQQRVIYDHEGNIVDTVYTDVNAQFEKDLYSRKEAIGRSFQTLSPEIKRAFLDTIKTILTENSQIIYTHYLPHADKYIEIIVSRSYLEGHIEMFGIDTTALHKTQDDLRMARDHAEEANRLKSAFLANMSHEIRTPLNAIVGFSEILALTEEAQEKQQYVSIIENNNALLLQLIGDILDLSKIEAGTLDFVDSDFDLGEMMREEANIIRMRLRAGVELLLDLPEEGLIVRCDRNRLSQVVINLLTNAAKFTQQGTIRLGYTLCGGELRFHVSDTGCGMPVDRIETIFDRFVKLNSFQQGTGLGLPICKTIIEHMGGRITVQSEEGRGSTFCFTLPYVAGKLTPRELPQQKSVAIEKSKLTLLVAEDNESNYMLFDSILRSEYRIIHAKTGREAVELFQEHKPHLVIMDINMPEMNGYEAAEEIHKISDATPIVAVTAFTYASDEQKMLASGFDSYIPKPINASKLKSLILETLKKRVMLI